MRPLTFRGYLDTTVRDVARRQTRSLAELAAIARRRPALIEPLFLWAAKTNRATRLSDLFEGRPALQAELARLTALERTGGLEATLESRDPGLRDEYVDVWRAYVDRRDVKKHDDEMKLQARNRVLALEANKHVTRYRMAKDLGLNPGNLHAFLAHGNPKKISLKRAFDLVGYLEVA